MQNLKPKKTRNVTFKIIVLCLHKCVQIHNRPPVRV